MVVLVDDEKQPSPVRRFRPAPPVPNDLRKPQQQQQQQQYQYHAISPEPTNSGTDSDAEREGRPQRYSGVYTTQQTNSSTPRHIAEATRTNQPVSTMSERRIEPSIKSKDSFAL